MRSLLSYLGLMMATLFVAAPAQADDGVLIFGGTRNTGLEVAKVLVARGESVTAFVRPTSNLENLEPLKVDYFRGDALNADDVLNAMAGKNFKAIISTLGGGRGENPPDVIAARNLVAAAENQGINRLIVVTVIGPGKSWSMVPPSLRERMRPAIEIKAEAEQHILGSNLDYTIIRPGQLTKNPRSGVIKLSLEPGPTGPITRADLADMVVWAYDNDESIRQIYHAIGDDPLAEQRPSDGN